MKYKDSALLAYTFKAWLRCTWNFELASGIMGPSVPGRIGSWVGFDLVRLKGGGWLRNTVDRQRCTVSFIAFSCESYRKKRDGNVYVWFQLFFIWFDLPVLLAYTHSPHKNLPVFKLNCLTSKLHSDTLFNAHSICF